MKIQVTVPLELAQKIEKLKKKRQEQVNHHNRVNPKRSHQLPKVTTSDVCLGMLSEKTAYEADLQDINREKLSYQISAALNMLDDFDQENIPLVLKGFSLAVEKARNPGNLVAKDF